MGLVPRNKSLKFSSVTLALKLICIQYVVEAHILCSAIQCCNSKVSFL